MAKLLFCAKFCLIFSAIGAAALCALGITLLSDYQYLNIKDKQASGATCLYSALIYFGLGFICLLYVARKPRIHLYPPDSRQNSWPEI